MFVLLLNLFIIKIIYNNTYRRYTNTYRRISNGEEKNLLSEYIIYLILWLDKRLMVIVNSLPKALLLRTTKRTRV